MPNLCVNCVQMVGVGTSDVNLDKYRHTFCSLLGKDTDSWGLSYTGKMKTPSHWCCMLYITYYVNLVMQHIHVHSALVLKTFKDHSSHINNSQR